MGSDAKCELSRGQIFEFVTLYVIPHFLFNGRQVEEVALEFFCHPDPRQICVMWSIPEPPAHLKKGIIRGRGSNKVADHKPLQRQASGESIPPNDDLYTSLVTILETIRALI